MKGLLCQAVLWPMYRKKEILSASLQFPTTEIFSDTNRTFQSFLVDAGSTRSLLPAVVQVGCNEAERRVIQWWESLTQHLTLTWHQPELGLDEGEISAAPASNVKRFADQGHCYFTRYSPHETVNYHPGTKGKPWEGGTLTKKPMKPSSLHCEVGGMTKPPKCAHSPVSS